MFGLNTQVTLAKGASITLPFPDDIATEEIWYVTVPKKYIGFSIFKAPNGFLVTNNGLEDFEGFLSYTVYTKSAVAKWGGTNALLNVVEWKFKGKTSTNVHTIQIHPELDFTPFVLDGGVARGFSISSSDAGDTSPVIVEGVDTAGHEKAITITLTGTTPIEVNIALKQITNIKMPGRTASVGQVKVVPNLFYGLPPDANLMSGTVATKPIAGTDATASFVSPSADALKDNYGGLSLSDSDLVNLVIGVPYGQ